MPRRPACHPAAPRRSPRDGDNQRQAAPPRPRAGRRLLEPPREQPQELDVRGGRQERVGDPRSSSTDHAARSAPPNCATTISPHSGRALSSSAKARSSVSSAGTAARMVVELNTGPPSNGGRLVPSMFRLAARPYIGRMERSRGPDPLRPYPAA